MASLRVQARSGRPGCQADAVREQIGLLELLHPAGAPGGTAAIGPSPPRWLLAGEAVASGADLVAVDASAGAPDELARRAVALSGPSAVVVVHGRRSRRRAVVDALAGLGPSRVRGARGVVPGAPAGAFLAVGHASAGDDGLLAGLAARARDRRWTFGLDVSAPPVAAPLCAWLDPAGGDAIVLRPSWRGPDGSAVVRLVRDGSIAAVGKLGLGPASAGVGDREAAAVAALGPPARAAGARVPELRGTVALAGRTAAVLSALDGRPLARASRHRVEQATRPVVEWLARFVAATTGRAEAPGVVEAALLAPAREVLSRVAGATAYLEGLEGLGRRLGDGLVPVAAAHGDLTTWNVLDGGEPGVVDWEGAQTASPPLVDLPYLLVDSRLVRTGGDDRLAAFQACFPTGGAVELRAGTLELDPEVALLSFHACLLGHALDEHRRGIDGPFRAIVRELVRRAAA